MLLGVSQNNDYNAASFASITQAMQDAIQPNAAFGYSGSTAILDCATPPAPTSAPSSTRYFVAPFQAGGYAASGFPKCQVATLAQFQSDEFRDQYNRGGGPYGGGLNWLTDLPASLACGLTVVPFAGGAPGTLSFERGSISVFGVDTGAPLCNGPYNASMRIGTTQNNNYNPAIFSTLTPWMQSQAAIGSFTYTGVLALVACGPAPVPTPAPLPASRRFRIASYDSSGYPSDGNCSVATLASFMSSAFREQYNIDGVLPFQGPISNWVSCNMAILSHPGGQIATLGWQRGAIVPFSAATGAALCNGPYESAMKIGASQDNNYNAAIFDSITQGMQDGATLNAFVYTGSLTLLDCDPAASPPTPAPAPVTLNRFVLGAYEPSGAYAANCTLATLEAFQSAAFRRQYNLEHALERFGVVPNSYSCNIAVAQYAGGPAATLSFQRGTIVAFGRDGAELCNGPYNSTMKIGTSQDNNYNAQLFDSMTQGMQQQTGLGSFSSNETLALVDCGSSVAAQW